MRGLLLDRQPDGEVIHSWVNPHVDHERQLDRAPAHVKANLKRAAEAGLGEPRNSLNSWEEVIYRATADQTAVTNVTTEADMLTATEVPTLPARYLIPGKILRWTLWGRSSTVVTTPGTIIFRLKYGAIGGTQLVASKAQRPKVTVSTNMAAWVQFTSTVRAEGATGSVFTMGQCALANTIGDAAASQEAIWPDVPAAVTIDTNTATAWRPTVQHSVATATTSWQTHMAKLEAMN